MKRFLARLAMLLTVIQPTVSFATDLVIVNANIINPGKNPQPKLGYIVIHNDRMSKVGIGVIKLTKGVNVFDAHQQYVIPGLIDSHNHIDTILGLSNPNNLSQKKLANAYKKQLPRSYLYFGYTTIIDTVTVDKNAINEFNATVLHPDLYTCGGGVMIANGYPMNYSSVENRYEEFPNFLYEQNTEKTIPKLIDPLEHTPEKIMQRITKAGAVCVKIFYETGFGADNNLPLPSITKINELVQLAHKNHLPVIIHANSIKAQEFALQAGVDGFAHGLWNWGVYDGQAGLPHPVKLISSKIIQQHLGYQPTIQVFGGLSALFDNNFLNDTQLSHVIPQSLLDWYKTDSGQWYVQEIQGSLSKSLVVKRIQMKTAQITRVLHDLQLHHANLLFGTDTPSGPTYGNPPGYNGYLEMQSWYKAKVNLVDILNAATINNAVFFHLEKNYGSITTGKIANLVIMKKNPLKDISAYDSISAIVVHGSLNDRVGFSADLSIKPIKSFGNQNTAITDEIDANAL